MFFLSSFPQGICCFLFDFTTQEPIDAYKANWKPKMREAAKKFEFEKASKLRDQVKRITHQRVSLQLNCFSFVPVRDTSLILNGGSVSTSALDLQHVSMISHVVDKNEQAHRIIQRYATEHAFMDIGLGLVSLIPGVGIPAIIGAIALQSKVIYKPMAEEIANVYLAETDAYTDRIGAVASVSTVALEFAQEFALEFLAECAQELLVEAGMGALATCIPFAGAAIAAGLDYMIAQMLTWRVGAMTSIYFQNGASWIGDRKNTMHIAKDLTGRLTVSMSELMAAGRSVIEGKAVSTRRVRVNLDDIPKRVQTVKDSGVRTILPLIKKFADKLPKAAVRESLIAMGLSAFIVDAAMSAYYATT